MSHHEDPRNSQELTQALHDHHLATHSPSQLSDAFRLGWWAQETRSAEAKPAKRAASISKADFELQLSAMLQEEVDRLGEKHGDGFMRKAAEMLTMARNAQAEAPSSVLCLCKSCALRGSNNTHVPSTEMRWNGTLWVCEKCWDSTTSGPRHMALRLSVGAIGVAPPSPVAK